MQVTKIQRNAVPNYPCYQPLPLKGKDAVTFVVLITDAFSVEERDIISHWFRTVVD